MNHHCHGDIFEYNGKRWYRCFLDGTICPAPLGLLEHSCPNCNRPGKPHDATVLDSKLCTRVQLHNKYDALFWVDIPDVTD